MAKARIGHFVEAQILEFCVLIISMKAKFLTPADEECHIDKQNSRFLCLRARAILAKHCAVLPKARKMIRTKGEAGETGTCCRSCPPYENHEPRDSSVGSDAGGRSHRFAKQQTGIPYETALKVKELGRLPVV